MCLLDVMRAGRMVRGETLVLIIRRGYRGYNLCVGGGEGWGVRGSRKGAGQ